MGNSEWDMEAEGWSLLIPGTSVTVVKLAPDGTEAARYPGTVLEAGITESWILVKATWSNRQFKMNGLSLVPGDTLHEYFSPAQPFNVFSVFSPEGNLRGWYANVTHPPTLDSHSNPPVLCWHDLYLDVVALPDGSVAVRDEDELSASGLQSSDPTLHTMILTARDKLLSRFAGRVFPFHETPHQRKGGEGV